MGLKDIRQKRNPNELTKGANPISTEGIGETKIVTRTKSKPVPKRVTVTNYVEQGMTFPAMEVPKLDGEQVIPMGYTALGKHDLPKLMWLKEQIIQAGICSFDYETDGDPDEDSTDDPQDHTIVGVSVAYKLGMAVYLPMEHVNYGANWDRKWLIENFLKPILLHPNVYVIAHNVKAEHQWSVCENLDFFPKTYTNQVMDTLLMVKALALPENTNEMGEVVVGLKPATKALLADENGMVHGLLHVDQIKSFRDTVGKVSWEVPIPGEFYKSGAKKGQQKTKTESRFRTFNELPVDQDTIDYACSDSDWALGIFYKLLPKCEEEGLLDVLYELDVPFMMCLGEYELAGWHINPTKLEAMRAVADKALLGDKTAPEGSDEWRGLEDRLYEALVEVTEEFADTDDEGQVIVPAGRFPMGSWRGDDVYLKIATPKPFNWGSNQHLPWLFFHVLKCDTRGLERSKATGLPGTGKDNLDKIIDGYDGDNAFMKLLKEKKKYDKILSTYVDGMLPYCREDTQKLHTKLNLVSTWRLSSKKPNLQNIPRADNDPMGIRGVFEAPFYVPDGDYSSLNPYTKPVHIITERKLSGHTFFIGSDYSQIELKVLAWFAGDKTMIETLANGGDLHSVVAKEVFKLDCTVDEVKKLYKPFRYRAKKVNFGIVYGMTEFGLSKDPQMGMTKDEAKVFIENYMARFPGVRQYAHEQIAFARKHGYVETMFMHRRPIPEINHPSKFIRQAGENKAMNTPIQGSASDIIRQAMVNIKREIPKSAPYLRPVMQIHDEIQVECPVEYAIEGARFVKAVMEREVEGFSDIMPIVSEPAVGKVWQHALDITFREDGSAYVRPKKERKEATDVTYDDIESVRHLYELAGIEIA